MSIFFTDRNLGRRFPLLLFQSGLKVKVHDDYFDETTPDDEILAFVAVKGWVLLTADARMRYVPAEKEAIVRHKTSVIHLKVSDRWTIDLLAASFVENATKVERFLSKHPPPLFAVFRIKPGGKVIMEKKV